MLAPRRLAEKLRQIRATLKISQAEMVLIVNPFETEKNRARISQYERKKRIPSTVEISNYAKFVGISTDVLLDDELDLPVGLCRAGRHGKAAAIPLAVIDEALGKIILGGEPSADDASNGTNGQRGSGTNTAIADQPPNKKENESSDKPADQTDESVQIDDTGKDDDDDTNILPVQNGQAKIPVASSKSADSFVKVGEQLVDETAPFNTKQPPTDCRCQTFNPNAIPENDEMPGEIEIPQQGGISDENQQRTMPIAAQTLFRLGEVYLELLPLLAHERWSQMSFDIFIEQMIAVGINDYKQRKTESAIACRLRAATGDFTP